MTPPPRKSSSTRKRTLDIEKKDGRQPRRRQQQHDSPPDADGGDDDASFELLGGLGGIEDGAEDNIFASPPESSSKQQPRAASTGPRPSGGGILLNKTPRTPRMTPSVVAFDDPIKTPADFYETGYTPLPGPSQGAVVPEGAFADDSDLLGIFSPGGFTIGPGGGIEGAHYGAALEGAAGGGGGHRGLVLLDGFRTPHYGHSSAGPSGQQQQNQQAQGQQPFFPRAYAYGGMLMNNNAYTPHASQRPRVCINNFRFGRVAVVASSKSSSSSSSTSSASSSADNDCNGSGVQREVAISPISDLRSMSKRGWPNNLGGPAAAGPSAKKARLPALGFGGGFVTPSVSVSSSGRRGMTTHPLTVSSCASSVASAGLPSLGAISINPELQEGRGAEKGTQPPTSKSTTPARRSRRTAASSSASGARGPSSGGSARKSADAEKFWSSVGSMTPNVGCEHQFVANLLEEDRSRLANDLIDL